MTMHQKVEQRTYSENRGLFEVYFMGYREGLQGRPLRPGHDTDTASQRQYREGHNAGLKAREEEERGR